jgi:hypothetical protein
MSDRFLIGDKQWHTTALKWQKATPFEIQMYASEVDKILGTTLPRIALANTDSVENYYDCITTALHASAAMYIPKGQYKSYLKPYWKGSNLNFYHYQNVIGKMQVVHVIPQMKHMWRTKRRNVILEERNEKLKDDGTKKNMLK